MRVHKVEQDFTGILAWRLHPEDNFRKADKEVYEAEDSLGKHIRLLVRMAPCGAITELEFRRAEKCRCKRNDDGHAAGYCNSRRGGFGGGDGFAEDRWN